MPEDLNRSGQPESGSVRDAATIVDGGGPPAHGTGVGAGQLVPGPADQPVGSVGPFDGGTVEDAVAFLLTRLLPGAIEKEPGTGGAAEDTEERRPGATNEFNPYTPTQDGEAHAHLTVTDAPVTVMRVLDARKGDWADPTNTAFDGYAKDGTKYTAGVQDGGPVQAPWASEGASNDRSSRADCPDLLLCVAARDDPGDLWELVLYDLDGYPGTLDVWMRFLPVSGGAFCGGVNQVPHDVAFFNGVLALVNSTTVGRMHLIDFKSDDQDVLHVIGSDDHFIANVGKTIVNRNVTGAFTSVLGGRPELRILSEVPTWVRIHGEGTSNWVVVGGEDSVTSIEALQSGPDGSVPQEAHDLIPLNTPTPQDPRRVVEVSTDGWLWLAVQNRLIRNIHDWRTGGLVDAGSTTGRTSGVQRARHAFVVLPFDVLSVAATRNFVFCATSNGVYRVDKVTLSYVLAYTIAGGNGGGRLDVPGGGEVLPGDVSDVASVDAVTGQVSSYLVVAMKSWDGGAVVIRLFDDVVFAKEWPALAESGANVARMAV